MDGWMLLIAQPSQLMWSVITMCHYTLKDGAYGNDDFNKIKLLNYKQRQLHTVSTS